jgi:DNA-binding NarL/FixJ family response regulator
LTASDEKIRVAVCDDHELFRRGVVEMLSFVGDIEVVAEAASHEEAVAVVSEYEPDVVLLDLEMPGGVMGADESMSRMLGLSSPPRVVVFTMHDEPGMVRRFLSRGATVYFPKSVKMGELVGAVRNAARIDLEPPEREADTPLAPGDACDAPRKTSTESGIGSLGSGKERQRGA